MVHINRNLPNRIWELYTKKKFSTDFANSKACPTSYNLDEKWNTTKKYQTYKKHVIDAVRRRSAAEFALAQTEAVSLERPDAERNAWLVRACRRVAKVIVLCFTGDHSRCDTWSRLCRAKGLSDYVPRHLPNNSYLCMSDRDKVLLFEVLLASKFDKKMPQHNARI